ncbi:MAG: GGDEF domain-containing protein [Spirochaetales bacterium]|nr:GGDEF domain-containing protein [Spirochaetales bacterium]
MMKTEIKKHSRRHPLSVLILSVLMYTLFYTLLQLPFLHSGKDNLPDWSLSGETGSQNLALPFHIRTRETKTITVSTQLGVLQSRSLCIAGMDVTAIRADINGEPIYELGDIQNPTANLWNSMILIPLPNSPLEVNEISLALTGNYFISLTRNPFLMDKPRAVFLSGIHRMIYHDLMILLMGGAALTGFYLIGFALIGSSRKLQSILLGIACLAMVIYSFEFTFRLTTGPMWLYQSAKRIMLSCAYLGAFAYAASIDIYCNKGITVTRWMALPSVLSILTVICAPSLEILYRLLVYMNIVLFVDIIIVIVMVYRKLRVRPLFLIPTVLVSLSLVQITWIIMVHPGSPGVLQYAIVLGITLFGQQLIRDRRKILQERDSFKDAYNRDPLTNAFNRRALNSIAICEYSTAVFLDFDHFKYFNDKYGHEKGDRLLIDFVLQTNAVLRKEDLVVRYGGDEFLLLLKEADRKAAESIVERIRVQFRKISEDDQVDISYGLSAIEKGSVIDINLLDEGMYSMKEKKRRST